MNYQTSDNNKDNNKTSFILPTSLMSQRSIDSVIHMSLEFQRMIVTNPQALLTFYEQAPPVHLHQLKTTTKVLLFLPIDVETMILHMSS